MTIVNEDDRQIRETRGRPSLKPEPGLTGTSTDRKRARPERRDAASAIRWRATQTREVQRPAGAADDTENRRWQPAWQPAAIADGPLWRIRVGLLEVEPANWRESSCRRASRFAVARGHPGGDGLERCAPVRVQCAGGEIDGEQDAHRLRLDESCQPGDTFGDTYHIRDSWAHAVEIQAGVRPSPAHAIRAAWTARTLSAGRLGGPWRSGTGRHARGRPSPEKRRCSSGWRPVRTAPLSVEQANVRLARARMGDATTMRDGPVARPRSRGRAQEG